MRWSVQPIGSAVHGRSQALAFRSKALFENLEDGATVDDFIQWFPGVERRQVEAVLEHAARSLSEA